MADLQSLRIFTQISAGKCTNFGIVALIHLCVDKPVFNLDGVGFPGKLLLVSDIDNIYTIRLLRRDGSAEERRSNPMLEVRIQLLRSAQQNLPCEAGYAEMRHYLPW